jgi:SLOG in TRPM
LVEITITYLVANGPRGTYGKDLPPFALQYVCVSAIKGPKEEDEDLRNLWKLMEESWRMKPPRLIISVTGGAQKFFMKRRLLTGFKRGLMKVATTAGIFMYRRLYDCVIWCFIQSNDVK